MTVPKSQIPQGAVTDRDQMAPHQWRETRAWLNQNRWTLSQTAADLYPDAQRVAGTVLLAGDHWIPPAPVRLETLEVVLHETASPATVTGREPASEPVRAQDENGAPFASYSEAMRQLNSPKIFENRLCYGLANIMARRQVLEFAPARYFANIDIGEAVAHEYAAAARLAGAPTMADLPFRRLVGDPMDLSRRPVPVAISTLVLRNDTAAGQAQMVLHWRDPAKVASGGGLYQVAPVGVFQPSDDAEWNIHNDFDVWRSIMRELGEELLGGSEDYHSATRAIDYASWPFARQLDHARASGQLHAYWLGAGIDPLTLVCDLLCVVAFDADLFDDVFAGIVAANDEGHLISGQDQTGQTVGVPFTADCVEQYSVTEPMQPAGAALLQLAWQHRHLLGG